MRVFRRQGGEGHPKAGISNRFAVDKSLRTSDVSGKIQPFFELLAVRVAQSLFRVSFRFCQIARPAWENDRRLKINGNGVYDGSSKCNEVSNFRNSATKPSLTESRII